MADQQHGALQGRLFGGGGVNQWDRALRKANEIRTVRTAERVRIGRLSRRRAAAAVAEIVLRPGDDWVTAKLVTVLCFPRGRGRAAAGKYCRRVGVSPETRLGDLPGSKRLALSILLSPEKTVEMTAAA